MMRPGSQRFQALLRARIKALSRIVHSQERILLLMKLIDNT